MPDRTVKFCCWILGSNYGTSIRANTKRNSFSIKIDINIDEKLLQKEHGSIDDKKVI